MKFREIFKSFDIKILIVEVLVFSLLIFIAGYLINHKDPLFINSGINGLIYFIPLIVLTLFYGWTAGLLYLSVFAVLSVLLYSSFHFYFFLWMILFFLISSEFHYYWNKTLKEALEKNQFIESKLRDIAREMMLLKLSHDHLEKQYILKPVSLREIVYQIKENIFRKNFSEPMLFSDIFSLVSQTYGVKNAGMIKYNIIDGSFEIIVKGDKDLSFTKRSFLVGKAIETGLIVHAEDINTSDYLAVIPISLEKSIYLICIEDMDFLNFNTETLDSINLIFYYFVLEMQRVPRIRSLAGEVKNISVDFLFETDRVYKIYKKFKMSSSLVVFSFKNYEGLEELLELKIRKNCRALDTVESLKFNNNFYILSLLPFTPLSGGEKFTERLINILKKSISEKFISSNTCIRCFPITRKPKQLFDMVFN